MADPTTYRPTPSTIPKSPGVYKFRDQTGRVIYVGKAKNLRSRLSSYFQDLSQLHPRTRQMVTTANGVEWTVVASEVEALQLEYTWIKKFDPQFNVKYRDDKTYPSLAVSVGEEIPRAFFYRGPRRKGIRYFGPYSHAWAVRETLDLLLRVFPMRTCTKGVFNRHQSLGRPCLLGYIDKCAAPCVGKISAKEHREIVSGFCSFMSGRTDEVIKDLEQRMFAASEALDFEQAARLRDDLAAVNKITEQQAIVLGDGTDADVVAVAADELEASIQMFHVRSGRVRGQRGWVVERSNDTTAGMQELIQDFLIQFYSDAVEQESTAVASEEAAVMRRGVDNYERVTPLVTKVVPAEVLCEIEPADLEHTTEVLAQLRGSKTLVRIPQRGDKKALMETVHRNAVEALRQHKLKRVGDITARSAALGEIQDALMMDTAPLRIECTDISHIQGTDVVASLVVFEDGLPKKSDYRRFKIREAAGDGHSNDVASIAEVTRRRFASFAGGISAVPSNDELDQAVFVEETENLSQAEEKKPQRFAYPPQLYIVDGGPSQVKAAQTVLAELEITDVVVIGIAKRLEEIWLPADEFPLILPRNSAALFLLQHIRDEAHRFAISFHRQQRTARMKRSELDDIKGLGNARRVALIKHFGSLKKLKLATVEEITQVSGIGPKLAQNIFTALHP